MIELGSSDAAVILGCSPYKTPWRLWAELVGLVPESKEETEAMSWGNRLQSAVLGSFAESERLVIYREQMTMRHVERPYMRATPDGLLVEYEDVSDLAALILAEIKCGSGHPPPVPRVDWIVQALHQRMVVESQDHVRRVYVVAFGSLRMVSWEIPFHVPAMDRIMREEERFLDLVERQEPPPVMAADASLLHHRWPWSKPETVKLGPDLQAAIVAYAQGSEMVKVGEEMRGRGRALIESALQEHEGGVFPDGTRVTWRSGKDGVRRFKLTYREESE